jgi:hypothetical protein
MSLDVRVGGADGNAVIFTVGVEVSVALGLPLEATLGENVTEAEGMLLGIKVGAGIGLSLGKGLIGSELGSLLSLKLGLALGNVFGRNDGASGTALGDKLDNKLGAALDKNIGQALSMFSTGDDVGRTGDIVGSQARLGDVLGFDDGGICTNGNGELDDRMFGAAVSVGTLSGAMTRESVTAMVTATVTRPTTEPTVLALALAPSPPDHTPGVTAAGKL